MKGNELKKRLKQLSERKADVWLPADVFTAIRAFVRGAEKNYAEVDPSILQVYEDRVRELRALLDGAAVKKEGATVRLSHLDMIDLAQVSRYAESFPGDYAEGMEAKDIAALTKKLGQYTKAAFPED